MSTDYGKIQIYGCVFYEQDMVDSINELIFQGHKTQKPMDLCLYGLKRRSIACIKYQFNDLTDGQKLELLKDVIESEFIGAVIFILSQGGQI